MGGRLSVALATVALILAACASGPEEVKQPAPGELPWGEKEIAGYVKTGQRARYERWMQLTNVHTGKPGLETHGWVTDEFLLANDKGLTLQKTENEDGMGELAPQTQEMTWAQFARSLKALWAGKTPTITRASVKVAAGEFDCWLYEINHKAVDGNEHLHLKMWCIQNMPGYVAKIDMEANFGEGPVKSRMELAEFRR